MNVFEEFLDISVMNLLNNCNFFVMSYHLICCITFIDGNFLNGAELLPDALSVLFKFHVHVIHYMFPKLVIANSVCQMRRCIMDYFGNLLYVPYFCICCE